ncbi:MAG: hypothetical protein H6807_07845 [Planctomycetes bacterium]|nr:hypothetical protein [Planctomycetota bacterium]
MLRGHPGAIGSALMVLVLLLPLTACDKGPRRRGPHTYAEYRAAAGDPRYRAPNDGESTGPVLASDDGDFGPASGALEVTAADAIKNGQVPGSGSLKGRVTYGGQDAKKKKLDISKDSWCSANHEVFTEDLVVSGAGGLRNVVVYVSRGFNRFDFGLPTTPALLEQRGCKYMPHVLTMMAGQELRIVNDDQTSHNFHFTGRRNEVPNTTQTAKQQNLVGNLENAELTAQFRCDIHPWMVAPVRIFAHPYFALTDDDGNFEIKGLPPGNYEISFLHERPDMTCAPATISVEAGKAASLTAQFTR